MRIALLARAFSEARGSHTCGRHVRKKP
jgi:hypothetical protein